MRNEDHCEACGVPAPKGRTVGDKRGGHVGHEGSDRMLWFCSEHLHDEAVRGVIVREAFGELMEGRAKGFRPRSKKEAKKMERQDSQRAAMLSGVGRAR